MTLDRPPPLRLSVRPIVEELRLIHEIEARLIEALRTLARLPDPAPAPREPGAAMPPVAPDWWQAYGSDAEMLSFVAEAMRLTPSPAEIDRMHEALAWFRWLSREQQRIGTMRAQWPRPASWAAIGRKLGYSRTWARKSWTLGLMTVASRLRAASGRIVPA